MYIQKCNTYNYQYLNDFVVFLFKNFLLNKEDDLAILYERKDSANVKMNLKNSPGHFLTGIGHRLGELLFTYYGINSCYRLIDIKCVHSEQYSEKFRKLEEILTFQYFSLLLGPHYNLNMIEQIQSLDLRI
ncbi:hypothetical protein BpHYR1_050803 [Brachionus plicatilis]|uniref:Uncharacterized protein n=1 Tax=Brachionus plicatilis TaxID=10195 RepID=A0A3M7T7I9_BRAPC|nr:hypothetical protein BpHYR1_050803 [Brachionus plicatilis]